jgi:PLP dependent protein
VKGGGGSVPERLEAIRARIGRACDRVDRDPESVQLLAVSKMQPARSVSDAAGAGQHLFGENYVQHWLSKVEDPTIIALKDLRWHFIGSLQRNKIRFLLGRVHCIETVDRIKLARELSKRALDRVGGTPQQVLLEVNLAGEPEKAGFSPAQLHEVLGELLVLPGLAIDGLMAIPPQRERAEASRSDHRALALLRERLQEEQGVALPTLSMGMSSDFEVAIEEGSTRVRVGTGIFGPRPPRS